MKTRIGGLVQIDNLTRINLGCLPEQTSVATKLFQNFGRDRVNVHFIIQCRDDKEGDLLVFCIDRDDQEKVKSLLSSLQSRQEIRFFEVEPDVTCLGVYGPDFRIQPGLAGQLLALLESSGIDIQAISTSISTFSIVISSNQVDLALWVINQSCEFP